MMKKLALTGCLAVALAFNPLSAQPARAFDGENVIGLIFGLAALAALQNKFEQDDRKTTVTRPHSYKPYGYKQKKKHSKPSKRYGVRNYALPGRCVHEIRTARGYRPVVGERCLREHRYQTSNLPRYCRFSVQTRRRTGYAYSVPCLRDAGFVIGASRYSRR